MNFPKLNKLVVDFSRIVIPKHMPWLVKKSAEAWIKACTWWIPVKK